MTALCILYLLRNVQNLIRALEPVLDDGAKLQMLHYLSELLPEAEQQAFDRAAARMISRKMDSKLNNSYSTVILLSQMEG